MTLTDYLEFSCLTHRVYSNQIEEVLVQAGACSITIEETEQPNLLDEDQYGSTWQIMKLSALFDSKTLDSESIQKIELQLKGFPFGDSQKFCHLPERNWDEEWKKYMRPTIIGDDLWVGPKWKTPKTGYRHVVHIDPGLAFGTGSHETTYLCLEALVNRVHQDMFVVDFGCGTGILGIIACLLGASRSIGIDIDHVAVETANQNAKQNQVESRFKAQHLEEFLNFRESASVEGDIVVANILTNTLIENAQILKELVADRGSLILSGIMVNQSQMVSDVFQDVFEFSIVQRGDWVMLVGDRREKQ